MITGKMLSFMFLPLYIIRFFYRFSSNFIRVYRSSLWLKVFSLFHFIVYCHFLDILSFHSRSRSLCVSRVFSIRSFTLSFDILCLPLVACTRMTKFKLYSSWLTSISIFSLTRSLFSFIYCSFIHNVFFIKVNLLVIIDSLLQLVQK